MSRRECRQVAKAIVAPPVRAPVIVANDRHVLARVWTDPLVLNGAAWPGSCELEGSFDASVPGRDSYTARVGSARVTTIEWKALAESANETSVVAPFAQARASAVPRARTVVTPSPAPPIP